MGETLEMADLGEAALIHSKLQGRLDVFALADVP